MSEPARVDPAELPDDESPAGPVEELTREQIVEQVRERLLAEDPGRPFAAEVLANVYATSYDLERMIESFMSMGGAGGVLKLMTGFGRRKDRGKDTGQ